MPPVRRRPSGQKSGWNLSIIIETITDSVERIGADNAFYATIILLSFGLVASRRASVMEALGLAIGLTVGWICLKCTNVLLAERLARTEVVRLTKERELRLIKIEDKVPEQLSFWTEMK